MAFTKYDQDKLQLSLLTSKFVQLVLMDYDKRSEVPSSSVDLFAFAYMCRTSEMIRHIRDWYATPMHMLEGTTRVLMYGAAKYSRDNWKQCTNVGRYQDALLRHLAALVHGEVVDPESGLSHIDHVACNLMFLEYFNVN
jgi:hypothetical protein